ncbi:type II toxin-antitoxin system prevent-host-death family antitoxin [Roseiarcus fermentans]|uniref:type II toxin-antitoxin system Phd/YefM family antitoxin n=1 Tax=Roseiarcus fermentans TaxID=1473586 RepID=UPI0014734E8B
MREGTRGEPWEGARPAPARRRRRSRSAPAGQSRTVGHDRDKSAEEARNTLPQLLDVAERGSATLITKRGRPVAALAPIAEYEAIPRRGVQSSSIGTSEHRVSLPSSLDR